MTVYLRTLLALLGISLASCQSAPPDPSGGGEMQKLVVGYVALNATHLPSWVAKEQGIFSRYGLDVDLQYIPSGSSPTAALLADQIQIMVAAEQAIQATLSGGDLVYVAAPTSAVFFSLYTRPEIVGAATRKGKRIGITQAGSATDTAANMAVRFLGLNAATDVTKLNVGSAPNILAALQNGSVDAGILSSPTDLQARAAGMRLMVDVSKVGEPFPSGWAAASTQYIANHEGTIQAYVKSIAEAVAFEMQHPEQTQQILATYTKTDDRSISKEAYEQVVPYLNKNPRPDLKAVQTALDELSATVPAAKSATPMQFIDTRFTDQLEASGFIKGLYP